MGVRDLLEGPVVGPDPVRGRQCSKMCRNQSIFNCLCNRKLGSSGSRNLASQALPSWSRLGGEMGHQARVENG